MANFVNNQPTAENYLYPTSFQLSIARIPDTIYNCQTANVPGITVAEIAKNNPATGRTLKIPSQSLQFEDLQIKFLVDEHMSNWIEIYNWMQNLRVVADWATVQKFPDQLSDASLVLYSSANNPIKALRFHNMFPKELSSLEMDATVDNPEAITATVTFAFEFFTFGDDTL
jgi:hypothetical protein